MLYNPDWKTPTRPTKVSAKDFVGWLETHDPEKTYDFKDNMGYCLIGQYMATKGLRWGEGEYQPTIAKIFGTGFSWVGLSLPEWKVLSAQPQTFGAALRRTKKFFGIEENA